LLLTTRQTVRWRNHKTGPFLCHFYWAPSRKLPAGF